VFSDIVQLRSRGFLSDARAEGWKEILEYGLIANGLAKFEILLTTPEGKKEAYHYRVMDDGTLSSNDSSGGINFYGYPEKTSASIVLTRREGFVNDKRFNELLKQYGWGNDGTYLVGTEVHEKSFSKNGYGITRSRIIQ